jgi:hypothetical protein
MVLLTGALLLAAAVPLAQTTVPERFWKAAEAPAELKYYVSRADLVVAAMQDALRRELTQALEAGGPAHAVNACHIDVIGVTQRVGRESGVAAGRTGDRLRNPTNAPRAWAAPIVRSYAGRAARDVDGFAVDLGDAVGVLRPIAHREMCASCHGPADRLDPAVRTVLADRYPADKATGFREGEIRGWFWVEVKKN